MTTEPLQEADIDRVIGTLEFQTILKILVECGAPPTVIARGCLDMAEHVQALEVAPDLAEYIHSAARHYEDMASMALEGRPLNRD